MEQNDVSGYGSGYGYGYGSGSGSGYGYYDTSGVGLVCQNGQGTHYNTGWCNYLEKKDG